MNKKDILAVIDYAISQATTGPIAVLDSYTDDDMCDDNLYKQQINDLNEMRTVFDPPAHTITLVDHDFEDDAYVIRLLDDTKQVYITVERGMIFVDSHEPAVMRVLIQDDDYEPSESYDTSDGCDYYAKSIYADFIICALLNIVNKRL